MKTIKNIFVTAAFLMGANGVADHNSPSGSVDRLAYQAQALFNVVQYNPLRYEVKDSVFRFSEDTRMLEQCSQQSNPGLAGCASQCRGYLDQVRRSFYLVDQYLRDTYYEMPQVFQAYRDAKAALDAVIFASVSTPVPFPTPNPYPVPMPMPYPNPNPGHGGGGHGSGRMIVCTAVDSGWEEHGGGHRAYGRFIEAAQRNAMMQCQQFHGRCRILRCEQQ